MLITHQAVSVILKMLIAFINEQNQFWTSISANRKKMILKFKIQIQIRECLESSDTVASTDDLQLTARTTRTTRKVLGYKNGQVCFRFSRHCYKCSKSSTH